MTGTILHKEIPRRSLLGGLGLAGPVAAAHYAQAAPSPHFNDQDLSDVNRKFSPEGQVLPFAGNTLICHLPQQGDGFEVFDHFLRVYRDLPNHAFSRKLAALPTSSYHMTVLDGANQENRKKPTWPAVVPRSAPLDASSAEVISRLAGFRLGCELPLRMIVDERPRRMGPLAIPLRAADEEEARKLRDLRRRLGEALGVEISNPDAYGFHVTIAYRFAAFDEREEADYRRALAGWKAELAARIPVIALGAPEVCTFEDMYAYRRRLQLAA